MAKTIGDLTVEDFPGVNKEKLTEMIKAYKSMNRNYLILFIVFIIGNLYNFILFYKDDIFGRTLFSYSIGNHSLEV